MSRLVMQSIKILLEESISCAKLGPISVKMLPKLMAMDLMFVIFYFIIFFVIFSWLKIDDWLVPLLNLLW